MSARYNEPATTPTPTNPPAPTLPPTNPPRDPQEELPLTHRAQNPRRARLAGHSCQTQEANVGLGRTPTTQGTRTHTTQQRSRATHQGSRGDAGGQARYGANIDEWPVHAVDFATYGVLVLRPVPTHGAGNAQGKQVPPPAPARLGVQAALRDDHRLAVAAGALGPRREPRARLVAVLAVGPQGCVRERVVEVHLRMARSRHPNAIAVRFLGAR